MKVAVVFCLFLGAAMGSQVYQKTCEGKKDSGMCLAYMPMFYYDAETDSCKRFIYGGCQGNGNRYPTEEECLQKCKGYSQKAEDICSLYPDSGHCNAYFPMYYYDSFSGKCKEMIYGGCGGNQNRFATLEACQEKCSPVEEPTKRQVSKDVCTLEPETGLCDALFYEYYFDAKSGKCKIFVYGGCGGNGNRFNTEKECNAVCKVAVSDECSAEPEVGLCKAAIPRYYYDQASGDCKKFTYGGCGGNSNNYRTKEACLNACT